MRYSLDHKAKGARSAAESQCTSLKTSGFNGIGVDGLAAAAGVTSGAFYSNFPSKEAMLRPSSTQGGGRTVPVGYGFGNFRGGAGALISFVHDYISADHSIDPAEGCVMPALSADVSRAQPPIKDAYQRKMTALVQRIAGLLDGDASDRNRRAWSIVALMVGAIVISRGMPEQSESRTALLDSALSTASMFIDADDGAHHTSD